MPLASLFALALMAAPAPAAAAAGLPDEPVPAGAPSDDYGLVNWCAGALSGHMVLYRQVKPELDALPDASPKETSALDADQIRAGREYLELYKKAIEAAEKASPRNIADQGLRERRAGSSIWAAARSNTADGKARMWTWLGWELPGRCETAAERLYEKSLLSAQALGIDLVGGSSAASNKTVTPQIDPAAPTPVKPATAKKPSKGTIAVEPGPVAPTPPAPAASTLPASLAIEDQFQAEIEGRSSLPQGPGPGA